jgi:hypothetical protein
VQRGTTFNRSVQRTQRLTRPNTVIHTPRNAGVRTNTQRALCSGGITPQASRQGRFGSHFAARTGHAHFANVAPHRAWWRGLRAGFVAWYGPVFWPYAYSDIVDYAFWPYGYDDGFWFYAYDDFFDGVFWGEAGPPEDVPMPRRLLLARAMPGCRNCASSPAPASLPGHSPTSSARSA